MAVMAGSLYRALVAAQVPDDQAQKAAEGVAGYEDRISKLSTEVTRIAGDLSLVKWMLGFNLAITLAVAIRLFLSVHP